jgi:hypothetical protein
MVSTLPDAAASHVVEDPLLADRRALLEIHARALAIARAADPALEELLQGRTGPGPVRRRTGDPGNSRAGVLTSLRMLIYIREEARRLGTEKVDFPMLGAWIGYLAGQSAGAAAVPPSGGNPLH